MSFDKFLLAVESSDQEEFWQKDKIWYSLVSYRLPVKGKVQNFRIVDKKVAEKPAPTNQDVDVSLTTKQQQVFSIVQANPSGINPKSIGLEAGQEDSKAASWATGALKKLLEENLVVKEQASGNKVMYKPV